MNIGKQIKALRMRKGITQEALASAMHVTYQAVSKWETGVTLPDIQLLPELAVFFGVTIDGLFSLPKDAQLNRIENMLDESSVISTAEFERGRDYLLSVISTDADDARACGLLAALYVRVSEIMRESAVEYAQTALRLDPDNKEYHCALRDSLAGVMADYYLTRRYRLIDFYYELLKQYPDNRRCRAFMIDQLIADGRLDEAETVLDEMRVISPRHVLIHFYEGDIAYCRGKHKDALELWQLGLADHDSEEWMGYFSYAGRMEMLCRYDEAIYYYTKDLEQAAVPRYVDPLIAMARIYEHLGKYDKAVEMRRAEIDIKKNEWDIQTGAAIDLPLKEIDRLIRML